MENKIFTADEHLKSVINPLITLYEQSSDPAHKAIAGFFQACLIRIDHYQEVNKKQESHIKALIAQSNYFLNVIESYQKSRASKKSS